jgi:hypothetical protein
MPFKLASSKLTKIRDSRSGVVPMSRENGVLFSKLNSSDKVLISPWRIRGPTFSQRVDDIFYLRGND